MFFFHSSKSILTQLDAGGFTKVYMMHGGGGEIYPPPPVKNEIVGWIDHILHHMMVLS